MPKKITIENLAVMVNKGFKETATKLNDLQTDMDARFEEVNRRFDRIQLGGGNPNYERIERAFEGVMRVQQNVF